MPYFPHVDYLKRALKALSATLLESGCLGCDAAGVRLCMSCTQKIPQTRQRCIGCLAFRRDGSTCWRCIPNWHAHRLLAATSYRHPLVKRAVKTLKYRYDRSLVNPLALRMLTALYAARLPANPLFVPVPLNAARKRWRGFDQAAMLAQAASDIGLFSYAQPLVRTRNTSPQTKTSGRAGRLVAMTDAFECADVDIVRGRHLVLVDDVSTTGATLDSAAGELLRAGAQSVTGLVIARS